MKVSFVDDDSSIIDMFKDQAEEYGIDSVFAEDAVSAIAAIDNHDIDYLLCDGSIPAGHGRLPLQTNGRQVMFGACARYHIKNIWCTSSDDVFAEKMVSDGYAARSVEKQDAVECLAVEMQEQKQTA